MRFWLRDNHDQAADLCDIMHKHIAEGKHPPEGERVDCKPFNPHQPCFGPSIRSSVQGSDHNCIILQTSRVCGASRPPCRSEHIGPVRALGTPSARVVAVGKAHVAPEMIGKRARIEATPSRTQPGEESRDTPDPRPATRRQKSREVICAGHGTPPSLCLIVDASIGTLTGKA